MKLLNFPQRAILNKTKASLEDLQRSLDERLKGVGEDMEKITAEQEKVARGGDTVVARDQNNTKLQSQKRINADSVHISASQLPIIVRLNKLKKGK